MFVVLGVSPRGRASSFFGFSSSKPLPLPLPTKQECQFVKFSLYSRTLLLSLPSCSGGPFPSSAICSDCTPSTIHLLVFFRSLVASPKSRIETNRYLRSIPQKSKGKGICYQVSHSFRHQLASKDNHSHPKQSRLTLRITSVTHFVSCKYLRIHAPKVELESQTMDSG